MTSLLRFWGTACLLCLTILFAVLTLSVVTNTWFRGSSLTSSENRVAVIEVKGVIYKSGAFTRKIESLLSDKKIKALVVRINSPGGLVGPSQEIYQAIRKANDKIPVIASIGSVGASGGYYVALGARTIFANPGSLTASIGVISEFANLEQLYKWARVEVFTLKAGKLKDVGTETRKMTSEERQFLLALLEDTHKEFKLTVQTQRQLTPEEANQWTDGRVMTGSQAKAAKLIDELGGFEEAVAAAKKVAGLPEGAPVDYPEAKKKNFLRDFLAADEEDSLVGESNGEQIRKVFSLLFGKERGWKILFLAPIQL